MADTFIDNLDWVTDELITSTKFNQWWANMQNFHNGTALGDGIIVTRHLANAAVQASKIDFSSLSSKITSNANGTVIDFGAFKMFYTRKTSQTGVWTLIDYSAAGFTAVPYCVGTVHAPTLAAGWVEFSGIAVSGGAITTNQTSILVRQGTGTNIACPVNVFAIGV